MLFTQFFDRTDWFQLLEDVYEHQGGQLFVIYGKPFIGKSRLIHEWLNGSNHKVIWFRGDPNVSGKEHLRSFSQCIWLFEHSDEEVPDGFAFLSWKDLWAQLRSLSEKERLLVIVDEFTDLRDIHSQQKGNALNHSHWDGKLENANICIVLTSSDYYEMYYQVLSYFHAPLYGRGRVAEFKPWHFGMTKVLFKEWPAADRVALYAIFSGIPGYWELFDPALDLFQNIWKVFISDRAQVDQIISSRLALIPGNRESIEKILSSLAQGDDRICSIGEKTGLSPSYVGRILKILYRSAIVRREFHHPSNPTSPYFHYVLSDPYFGFYFRLNLLKEEMNGNDFSDNKSKLCIQSLFDTIIRESTWIDLCREWIFLAGLKGDLSIGPFDLDFNHPRSKEAFTDIFAIDTKNNQLVLGICDWQEEPAGTDRVKDLFTRAQKSVPRDQGWSAHLIGFSKRGWDSAAKEFVIQLSESGLLTPNCSLDRVSLAGFEKVDRDLCESLNIDTQRYRMNQ
jgi:hypothetical protein